MMGALNLKALAQTSASRIADCLIEGALMAMFAGAVMRLARRQSASARFAVWFSALLSIAATPFLGAGLWRHSQVNVRPAAAHAFITLPESWAFYLFGAWGLIAGWFLLGVARGLWRLHTLRKSCVPVDLLDPRLKETLARHGTSRNVALCTSDDVQVPTAIGLFRPAVVLPAWLMEELSTTELNQVVLHELAHLRRWDDWTNLAQKLIKAVFFFHPAVWWIERKLSLEREMACDDAVLAEIENPRAYAECLAHLAERSFIQRTVALAQAAIGRIRQTTLRVAEILNPTRARKSNSIAKPAVCMVAVFAVASVLLISRTPQLIAFDSGGTAHVTVATASPSEMRTEFRAPVPTNNAVLKVVPAKLETRVAASRAQKKPKAPTILARSKPDVPRMNTLVHLVSFRESAVPVAITETTFVVVEDNSRGLVVGTIYQIQMWRITLLHPSIDQLNNRIPHKEI